MSAPAAQCTDHALNQQINARPQQRVITDPNDPDYIEPPDENLTSAADPTRGFSLISNTLIRYSGISCGAKVLYLTILSYARADRPVCFPKQSTIAAQMNIDVRTVRTYMKEIVDLGIVQVTRRGLGKSNLYHCPDMRDWQPPTEPECSADQEILSEADPCLSGSPALPGSDHRVPHGSDRLIRSYKKNTQPKKTHYKKTSDPTDRGASAPQHDACVDQTAPAQTYRQPIAGGTQLVFGETPPPGSVRPQRAPGRLADRDPQLAADRDAAVAAFVRMTGRSLNGDKGRVLKQAAQCVGDYGLQDTLATMHALWDRPDHFWDSSNFNFLSIGKAIPSFRDGRLNTPQPPALRANRKNFGAMNMEEKDQEIQRYADERTSRARDPFYCAACRRIVGGPRKNGDHTPQCPNNPAPPPPAAPAVIDRDEHGVVIEF